MPLPTVNGASRAVNKRPSDDEVVAAYHRSGSVWTAGESLGMAGQSVHKRLVKLGQMTPMRVLTDEDKEAIRILYTNGFSGGDGQLEGLAKRLGRTKQFVCRYARTTGLTSYTRKLCAATAAKMSVVTTARWKTQPHPRGALGMKHTEATKMLNAWRTRTRWESMTADQQSAQTRKQLTTRLAIYGTLAPPRQKVSWKQGWRVVGGNRIYFRSRWEHNYAVYLQFLMTNKQVTKWEHEPETFWFEGIKRGCLTYLPDFRVTFPDGSIEYHEVKGWMDARSKTKLKRMAKYHPAVKMRVIDGKWFKANGPKLSFLEGWET